MKRIFRILDKQTILCNTTEDETGGGQGVYSDDSGEGESEFMGEEPIDQGAEDDSNLDADPNNPYANTTYTEPGEFETVVDDPTGSNPIDPVETVTDPYNPDDEGDEEEDDSIIDDPNWGLNNEDLDEQEGDGLDEEDEGNDELKERELDRYTDEFPFVEFSENMSLADRLVFFQEYANLPKGLKNIELVVALNDKMDVPGRYNMNGTIEFRSRGEISGCIIEECIHAYQDCVKGWNEMVASRLETEFEAKMTIALYEFTTETVIRNEISQINPNDRDIVYNFFNDCFGGIENVLSNEFLENPWSFFDEEVFLNGFETLYDLWLEAGNGYQEYQPNWDYEWNYWIDWINILRD